MPNCDLFEIRKLPNLGNGLDINYILDRDGCYLSLIQRKVSIYHNFKLKLIFKCLNLKIIYQEVTRLDAKYMIRVAEERGLFGSAVPSQSARQKRKENTPAPRRKKKHAGGFEVHV